MPLFWLFAEAAVNPRVIEEYVFPGGSIVWLSYGTWNTLKLAP